MVKKSTAQAGSGGKPDGGSPAAKPAPLSPQETKRRRIQKILAALGMSAAGLGTYLFQSDDKAPIDPPAARTATFDPSTGEGPDNASPAAMGIPSAVPTASFTTQLASERKPVEPEAAREEIYTLEIPVSQFLDTFVNCNTTNPKDLKWFSVNCLYSDLTNSRSEEEETLPNGVEPLIINGKPQKTIRVFLKPDKKNYFIDHIFGNLDFIAASPDPEENKWARRRVSRMGGLISSISDGLAIEMTTGKMWGSSLRSSRAPESIITEAISQALNILTEPDTSSSKTMQEYIRASTAPPSKEALRLRSRILNMLPPIDLANLPDDNYERLTKIQENPASSELAMSAANALREIASVIAGLSSTKTQKPQENSR